MSKTYLNKLTLNQTGPVVFPGSFDPLTNGHTDVIKRTLDVFESICVAVLDNPDKQYLLLSVEERIELIEQELQCYGSRATVKSFNGLLIEFMKQQKSSVIIRGLRAVSDYEYEMQLALINKKLSPNVETFFLTAQESYAYISSSIVKQIAKYKGDLTSLVPKKVAEKLIENYK